MRKIKNILCNAKVFGGVIITLSTILLGNVYLNSVYATPLSQTTTATTTIRVKSTCSMTATIAPGKQHAATMINGQYLADIGLTTIQTFCNDPSGYVIYAIGYTGGDAGVTAGTNTVLHSDTLGSTYDIVTGLATSGDASNWAMKISSVDGTYKPTILNGYNNYSLVPQNYTKIAAFNSNTDATIGSSLTTTYAAYIKPTQPAGTYEGQVKYVLLHPSDHEAPAGNYKMQDVEDWGGTIAIGQEVTAYDDRDNKAYTVRRMCMSGSGSTWQEKEANCNFNNSMLWMTQNLDLDLDSSVALTSENTDLNTARSVAYQAGYIIDQFGTITWTPATTTVTDVNTSTGSFNGFRANTNMAYSADPNSGELSADWYETGLYFDANLCYVNSNNQTCNYLNSNNTTAPNYFQKPPFTSSFITSGDHTKIGNYYNWSAAIASNDSSSLTSSTYDDVSNNPQNSICPKGWRLPTASSVAIKNEFNRLNTVYNSIHDSDKLDQGLFNAPIYMVRSGRLDNGSLYGAGYYGFYWSSTVLNSGYAYGLNFRSDLVNTSASNYDSYRALGRSIRCVSDF